MLRVIRLSSSSSSLSSVRRNQNCYNNVAPSLSSITTPIVKTRTTTRTSISTSSLISQQQHQLRRRRRIQRLTSTVTMTPWKQCHSNGFGLPSYLSTAATIPKSSTSSSAAMAMNTVPVIDDDDDDNDDNERPWTNIPSPSPFPAPSEPTFPSHPKKPQLSPPPPPARARQNKSKNATKLANEIKRLRHLRNVGVLAHVDAGKTTVTEKMLECAGVVHRAGCVDDGNTVTDFLPAERERGITIQSAAISFEWGWHNDYNDDDDDDVVVVGGGGDVVVQQEQSNEGKANGGGGGGGVDTNDSVQIHLIDTPGHVDFSVEVNRSVAVLDGAVLVVDAVAGVQAQTETVWNALRSPNRCGFNNHVLRNNQSVQQQQQQQGQNQQQQHEKHEPLPCVAFVNKMDKEGSQLVHVIDTIKHKLNGANPLALQLPLFWGWGSCRREGGEQQQEAAAHGGGEEEEEVFTVPLDDYTFAAGGGQFAGVVDLIHMRKIIWSDEKGCFPTVTNLVNWSSSDTNNELDDFQPINSQCTITQKAIQARMDLVANLANVDELMEEYYLLEQIPNPSEVRKSLRRATINKHILPVLTGTALRGKGVEPVLDAVADLLPGPLDRLPPPLIRQDGSSARVRREDKDKKKSRKEKQMIKKASAADEKLTEEVNSGGTELLASSSSPSSSSQSHSGLLGHPLNPTLLAMAFKVIHMKGRGGSGDGRIVFARVYSGRIKAGDTVRCITPSISVEEEDCADHKKKKKRVERIGGMLELGGGRFDNLSKGECRSGDVCALVGLKTVVTGDTILLASNNDDDNNNDTNNVNGAIGNGVNGSSSSKKKKKKRNKSSHGGNNGNKIGDVCLAGVASPKPVLTVRLEASSTQDESKLSSALKNLTIEDPSLVVNECKSSASTLLSGLGELHIEITLDRLQREFGLNVNIGEPSVAYRETLLRPIETFGGGGKDGDGMYKFDRTLAGGNRMEGSIHLRLEPSSYTSCLEDEDEFALTNSIMAPLEPTIHIGPEARKFMELDLDANEDYLCQTSELVSTLLSSIRGALKRGVVGPYPIANVHCTIVNISAENGLNAFKAMPGSLRAIASHAIKDLLLQKCSKQQEQRREEEEQEQGRGFFFVSNATTVLEPTMIVEVTAPVNVVGTVLSDLNTRRGTIGDVFMGDDEDYGGVGGCSTSGSSKALIRGNVPLAEILGYANSLRSLTGGEGTFTAEYIGHSPCPTNVIRS